MNITHAFVGDVVAVLKAPNGNVLNLDALLGLTNNAGVDFVNTVISSASTTDLATGVAPFTSTFKADAVGATFNFAGFPLPGGPIGFTPTVTTWAGLWSGNLNGNWTLALYDAGAPDVGTLTSWSINMTYGVPSTGIWSPTTGLYTDPAATVPYTGTPAQTVYASPTTIGVNNYTVTVANGTCTSPATTVPVTVNQPAAITAQPVAATVCTDKVATFSVTATGTNVTYQWQVSTDNGTTFTNVTNGGVYSGATSATLVITAPPVSLNNNIYRVIVNGAAPCGSVTSLQRRLTVNPLPNVVITAAPYTSLYPGLVTTLTSTVTPNAAATYTWLRDGAPVGGNTPSLSVDVDGLGLYTLRVTDVNGCVGTSNAIRISDSSTGKVFIYPNPNNGIFQVRYYSAVGNILPRGITVYDAQGARVLVQTFTNTAPYSRMDVDLTKYGKGVYWIELGDRNGNRLAVGRVIVQ